MVEQTPLAKTVFLCDEVVRDAAKNKVSILNMFDTVRLRADDSFPYHLRKICVFAECSDGLGPFTFYVEIERTSTEAAVYRSQSHTVTFTDRLKSVKISIRLTNCIFPEPGEYNVQLYCNTTVIGDRILHIIA